MPVHDFVRDALGLTGHRWLAPTHCFGGDDRLPGKRHHEECREDQTVHSRMKEAVMSPRRGILLIVIFDRNKGGSCIEVINFAGKLTAASNRRGTSSAMATGIPAN